MLVLDTSALLYWTIDPPRLSASASEAIDATDQIFVSSISIWEIALKVTRSRLDIPASIGEYVDGLQRIHTLKILPVDVDVWVKSAFLDWEHRDPADRVIVSTAMLLNAPLIATDRKIAAFYEHTIW